MVEAWMQIRGAVKNIDEYVESPGYDPDDADSDMEDDENCKNILMRPIAFHERMFASLNGKG